MSKKQTARLSLLTFAFVITIAFVFAIAYAPTVASANAAGTISTVNGEAYTPGTFVEVPYTGVPVVLTIESTPAYSYIQYFDVVNGEPDSSIGYSAPKDLDEYCARLYDDDNNVIGDVLFKIVLADMTGVSVVQNGTLTYTAEAQTANVTASATTANGSVATFKYSRNSGSGYDDTVPSFTEAGSHTVYYKATAPDHNEVTGSFTVTIGKAPLTITAQDKATVYGSAAPLFNVVCAGFVGGQNEGYLNGSLSLSCAYDTTDPDHRNAGEYDIVPSGYTSDNYEIGFVKGTLTVAPKTLTVTANDHTIGYGDEPTNNGVSISGFAYGEEMSVLDGGLSYAYGYTQFGDVGSYAITPSGFTEGNYVFDYVNGTLTVQKATLTVTIDSQEIYYGDEANPFTYTITGFVNGETEEGLRDAGALSGTLTMTSEYEPGLDPGTDSIYVEENTLVATNYKFNVVNGNIHSVARPITVTIYDIAVTYGDPAQTFVAAVTEGSIYNNGEAYEFSVTDGTQAVALSATTPAGCYYIVGAAVDPHYDVTFVSAEGHALDANAVGYYVIAPKTLTFSWTGLEDAVYSGSAKTVTATIAAGIVGTDDVEVGNYSDNSKTNVGNYTAAVTSLSGAAADNYTLVGSANTTFDWAITKKNLTLTVSVANSVYGTGVTAPTVANNGIKVTGLAAADSADILIPNQTLVVLYFAKDPNKEASVQYAEILAEINSMTPQQLYVFIQQYSALPTDVGTYYVFAKAQGLDNYNNAESVGGFQITKANLALTVSVDDTTYGTAITAPTIANGGVAVTGWKYGQTAEDMLSTANQSLVVLYFEKNPNMTFGQQYQYELSQIDFTNQQALMAFMVAHSAPPTAVGDYWVFAKAQHLDNYNDKENYAAFSIGKADLTLAVNVSNTTYGTAVTAPTLANGGITVSGWKYGDDESLITNQNLAVLYFAKDPSKDAGTQYAEILAEINSLNQQQLYAFVQQYSVLPTEAGTYYVFAKAQGLTNYNNAENVGGFRIVKKDLTITVNVANSVYGEGVTAPTVANGGIKVTGWVNGDDAELLTTQTLAVLYFAKDPDKEASVQYAEILAEINSMTPQQLYVFIQQYSVLPTKAGVYYVFAKAQGLANYNNAESVGGFGISKATLCVKADDKTVKYGDLAPTLTYRYEGFVNGDDENTANVFETVVPLSLSCDYQVGAEVGTMQIVLSGELASANYDVALADGVLTIEQRQLTIYNTNTAPLAKVYGDATVYQLNPASVVALGGDGLAACDGFADVVTLTLAVGANKATATPIMEELNGNNFGYAATYWLKIFPRNDNYEVVDAFDANAKLVVSPKALTITAESKTITYGDAAPAFSVTYDGFVGGNYNDSEAKLTGTLTFDCEYDVSNSAKRRAGEYTITPRGVSNGNYSITFVSGTLTVEPAVLSLSVTVPDTVYGTPVKEPVIGDGVVFTGWKYDDPTVDMMIPGLSPMILYFAKVSGKSFEDSYDELFEGFDYTENNATNFMNDHLKAPTEAGEYYVTATFADINYQDIVVFNTFTIAKKAVTVTAANKESIFEEELVALTATDTGILAGDAVYTLSTTADKNAAGTYPIVVALTGNGNYDVTVVNGTYTVKTNVIVDTDDNGEKVVEANKKIDDEAAKREEGVSIKNAIQNVLSASADASEAKLKVEIGEKAAVTFDKAALQKLAENVDVKISYSETKAEDITDKDLKGAALVIEISLSGASFEGGKATIVAAFENKAPGGKKAVVYYVDANGKKTDMKAVFADGTVSFETTHFSTYVVEYVLTGGAIAGIVIGCVAGAAAIAVGVFFFLKKRKAKKGGAEQKAAE